MKAIYKNQYRFITVIAFILLLAASCKKPDNSSDNTQDTGKVTDVDGNTYQTVTIGGQVWMAEDLKVTHYRNGMAILQVFTDSLQWATDTTGAYCNSYDNNTHVIGKFYNWYVVNNAACLAPTGWHIPTDDDWKQLEIHIGMNAATANESLWRGTNEGDKLKVKAPDGWTSFENVWGTNESGFSALAKGCRLFNMEDADPGYFATGFWWTATSNNNQDAWYRNLDYKKSNIFRSACLKTYGFSVRCVKD